MLLILSLISAVSAESCKESKDFRTENVIYSTDHSLPSHLKGATITVTQANGLVSTVPAEKFMVVPRRASTVVAKIQHVTSKVSCDKSAKNIVALEARKDYDKDLTLEAAAADAQVYRTKKVIPGVNYFRRSIIGPVGAGVGVDANEVFKALVGVEF